MPSFYGAPAVGVGAARPSRAGACCQCEVLVSKRNASPVAVVSLSPMFAVAWHVWPAARLLLFYQVR